MRICATYVVLGCLPLAASGVLVFSDVTRELTRQINDQADVQAESLAQRLVRDLEQIGAQLAASATSTDVTSAPSAYGREFATFRLQHERARALLRNQVEATPALVALACVRPAGDRSGRAEVLYASDARFEGRKVWPGLWTIAAAGPTVAARFRATSRRTSSTPLALDPEHDHVILAHEFRDSDGKIAALVAVVGTAHLAAVIDAWREREQTPRALQVMIIDQLGRRVVGTDAPGEGAWLAARAPIAATLELVVRRDADRALAPVRRARNTAAIIGAVVLVTSSLLGLLIARRISEPVSELVRVTDAVAAGDLAVRAAPLAPDEVGALGVSLNAMIARLGLALDEASRLAKLEHDLTMTAIVQSWFFPRNAIVVGDRVSIYGFCRAADACGGDWWWHHRSDHTTSVLVADVMGHGPGPALVTALLSGVFHQIGSDASLENRIAAADEALARVCLNNTWVSVTAVEVDDRSGKIRVYSAGGCSVIVVGRDGDPRVIGATGAPLGSSERRIAVTEHCLTRGDRLLLCTDGIVEARIGGRFVGARGLVGLLREECETPLAELGRRLSELTESWQGEADADDITFVVLEWVDKSRPRTGESKPLAMENEHA